MIYFIFIYLFLWLPDVYCYLKDPPPEFLPRFGTITMAGLLGMFLARKGTLIWSSNKMKCEKSLKSLHLPCLKLACIHLCDLMLGSRFKRTVVPLGLMSAAASVCYPAQAVAVVKVIQSLNVSLIRWCSERHYHCLSTPGDRKKGVCFRTVEQCCRVLALCLKASGGRRQRSYLSTTTGYHQYSLYKSST